MITSSFTGWNNYMMNLGKLMGDAEAMKRFGNTVVVWDLHTRKPKKIFDVPGAPLEIRCAWGPHNDYCFTTTALTSKIWLIYEDDDGEWQAQAVADIGDARKIPLPVDISISADDSLLWVDTWNDGKARLFDISDPFKPVQIQETKIGAQINMTSQSWDGKRIYFHLLAAGQLGQGRSAGRRRPAVLQVLHLGRQASSITSSASTSWPKTWACRTRCVLAPIPSTASPSRT